MDELLSRADFVTLHVPADPAGPVIGKDEIAKMKDGAYLINCARGGVVDEAALLSALNSGKLAGAGLDVFEEEPPKNMELLRHPKVSLTPHIGAQTKEAQARVGDEVVDILLEFARSL
jgi:D-3-phosphoglycerate dehydrogenase